MKCPVCRALALRRGSFVDFWRCSECGSRIPHETVVDLVLERLQQMAGRVAAAE